MNRAKKGLIVLIICVFGCLHAETLIAQANTGNGGNFGIGAMFGEPAGLSIKNWTGESSAINIGAAWSLAGRNEAIHLHADFLYHSWFTDIGRGQLAFYYGLGGRVIFADDQTAGVRIPLGLNYVFENIPFDLFVEAVPIFDVAPDTKFAGNGAFGLRYYF